MLICMEQKFIQNSSKKEEGLFRVHGFHRTPDKDK